MRRGLSRRRRLSAVGARSGADVRHQRRGHAQRACRGAARRVRANRPYQHGRRSRHSARRVRARGHAGRRSETWSVLTSDRSFWPSRRRSKAAREGVPVVIVNPSTPIGALDYKPTPTGRIIVDFLNRRMPAFMDTGLNLVDVEDVARGHLLAAERGADRREIYSRRRKPDAGADAAAPREAVRTARAERCGSPTRSRTDFALGAEAVARTVTQRAAAREPDRGPDGAQENVFRFLQGARGAGLRAASDR